MCTTNHRASSLLNENMSPTAPTIPSLSQTDAPASLRSLPVELDLKVFNYLDYASSLYLMQTCRQFYELLHDAVHPASGWRDYRSSNSAFCEGRQNLVVRAQSFPRNRRAGRLVCFYCLRLLPRAVFGKQQVRFPASFYKGGRFCMMCGALNAPGPLPGSTTQTGVWGPRAKSARVRKGSHYPNGATIWCGKGRFYLCWECGRWDTHCHKKKREFKPHYNPDKKRKSWKVCVHEGRTAIDFEAMAQQILQSPALQVDEISQMDELCRINKLRRMDRLRRTDELGRADELRWPDRIHPGHAQEVPQARQPVNRSRIGRLVSRVGRLFSLEEDE